MDGTGLLWIERGHWGLTTAVYLFAAALGGGSYLASLGAFGLDSTGDRQNRLALARWSSLVALAAVAVAGVAILSHLAAPLRGLLFPLTLRNFGSWITRGTWILVTLGVFASLQTLWFHFGALGREGTGPSTFVRHVAGWVGLRDPLDRLADWSRPDGGRYWAVALVGALPALGTVYTGFELAAVDAVPLWHHPTVIPVAFLASGVAAGIAAPLALSVTFETAPTRLTVGFAGAMALGFVVSAVLLLVLWTSLAGTPAASASKTTLTAGPLQDVVTLAGAGLVVSLVASPLLAWWGYVRGATSVTRWVVRPGLVATLVLGVVATFLVRYALLFAAVKDPVVLVGI